VLAGLGLEAETLIHTAYWMGLARNVLDDAARILAEACTRVEAGDVLIARRAFGLAQVETQYRLLAHALRWVGTAPYRPRETALTGVHAAISQRKTVTLAGCVVSGDKTSVRIAREHNAVRDLSCSTDQIWDNRWRMTGPDLPGAEIRSLGEAGLRLCPDWRMTGMPRMSLLSSPAVWERERLVAAPLAGKTEGWAAEAVKGAEDFFTSLIVH
jgi:tRNA(Ile)-lysidine synthase